MSRKAVLSLTLRALAGAIVLCTSILGILAVVHTAHARPSVPLSPRPVSARQASALRNPCPRFEPGSDVTQPPDLFSHDGVLNVSLSYNTIVDESDGFSTGNALQLFCFSTLDGKESPTLHVWPGDRLVIRVTNNIPKKTLILEPDGTINENQPAGTDNTTEAGMRVEKPCLDAVEHAASANIHFHGLNVAATCGQDDVLHTVINPGHTFTYNLQIPANEPPGLYWYHPHIHGINEGIVQGGATAAIVVEGVQNIQPAVADLPAQTLIIRDQPVPGYPTPVIGSEIPSWDISVNYVTIRSCQDSQPCDPSQFVGNFTPAVMHMKPSEKQFWRVVNSASHTAIDLQLLYDGKPQPLTIVGLDGVPVNSQDGTQPGKTFTQTDIPLAPAARAEFIITGPSASVQNAVFETLRVPTGPDGDNHPTRPLFTIQTSPEAPEPPVTIPRASALPWPQRFAGLADARPTGYRKLYFSEVLVDPNNPLGPTNFFITVDGATPTLFSPDDPPAIVTTQGSVEDWTIENRAQEVHAFHMHQIHFLLLARDGVPVPPEQRQYLDMVNIPFWTGTGPYPNITVRMDFRGADVGDFVYHCHFIFHADFGMMAIIRVLPNPFARDSRRLAEPAEAVALRRSMASAKADAFHSTAVHSALCGYVGHGRYVENGRPFNSRGISSSNAHPSTIGGN